VDAKHVIQDFYEGRLAEFGPTARGMDWEGEQQLELRFRVMTGIFDANEGPASLLDLGCGAGLLHDHLEARGLLGRIDYTGIDISPAMIAAASARKPEARFSARDVLAEPLAAESFDYVVANGVLTVKEHVNRTEMWDFAKAFMATAFRSARKGLAVNLMSAHVDWEKERLFHVPLDDAMAFFKAELSRHVLIRHDYGLWEYTAYVFREPNDQ